MKQVLYIGMNPATLDFSQPGFAPGLTAEIVQQGIDAEINKLARASFETTMHFLDAGDEHLSDLTSRLQQNNYDGVLVGAGIRVPPGNMLLFENIINIIHSHAPNSKIIFNTTPVDSLESVKRWLEA